MGKNLNDLYFGIKLYSLSYSNEKERQELQTYNLFDLSKVKWSVARYVAMDEEEKKNLLSSPLHFCFGDVWSRTQFEFIINTWPYKDDEKISNGLKVDTWTMYVEPNAEYLMELVNSVDKKSAEEYLKTAKG